MKKTRHNVAGISQAELNQVVCGAVEKYLEALSEKGSLRIEGEIPDFTDYVHSISFANNDFVKRAGSLYEELTAQCDLQKVKDVICWEFNLLPQQFHIEERTDKGAVVSMVVFVLNKGVSRIEIGEIKHRMGTFDYFERAVRKPNSGFVVLVFEPRLQQ